MTTNKRRSWSVSPAASPAIRRLSWSRLLVKADYRVQVIMSRGAMEFVTPLTFQTLSGNPVASETFSLTQESEIGHINLADSADLFVIAPATANAVPLSSVVAVELESEAASEKNWTETPGTPDPATSSTRAEIVVGPPFGGSVCGDALMMTRSAAALPTFRFSSFPDAPPENAVIVAVPFVPFEMNRTRTWPLFVLASLGSIRPIVVVKETSVPFCTGVPAPAVVVEVGGAGVVGVPGVPVPGVVGGAVATPFSMTVTTISISPLIGTFVAAGNMVMIVPVGARAALAHAAANERIAMATRAPRTVCMCRICATICDAKDNTLMCLRGKNSQRGYTMAALLVSIGVMMLLMSVAMPVWRHQAQREKEAELIFRGEQYARAVNHYQRKMGPGNFPPSIDVLVQQRFLRKKYKDPMTEDGEFGIIPVGGATQPGVNPQLPSQPGQSGPGRSGPTGLTPPQPQRGQPSQVGSPFSAGQNAAGIMGVRSKSKGGAWRLQRRGDPLQRVGFHLREREQPAGWPGRSRWRGTAGRSRTTRWSRTAGWSRSRRPTWSLRRGQPRPGRRRAAPRWVRDAGSRSRVGADAGNRRCKKTRQPPTPNLQLPRKSLRRDSVWELGVGQLGVDTVFVNLNSPLTASFRRSPHR